ncbi:zinc-dependent peptidase [Desertivirga arenae]|uniref:M90 family metallopeptidase n=1 Tax=Desertivirga arenae TaxID=2810309 RepID=UPI001A978AC2|nr:M90 family metallopeptidase [Pedobacter sp. SYSU D00823]
MLTAVILSALFLLAIVVLLSRKPRRQAEGIPEHKPDYKAILQKEVLFYRQLMEEEKNDFAQKVASFLEKTRIEGIGTEINDKDRVLVAASAIIPIFRFGNWRYKNITNVILYPDTFNHDFQYSEGERNIMGMVGNGFMNGQMILSKSALHHGFREPGGNENTAIHEFVHLLDAADGSVDGIPELLLNNISSLPWIKAMEKEISRIEKGKSDINPYALTNEAEFFAVVSEYFFEKPAKFKEKHPALYEMLDKMFNPENNSIPHSHIKY